RLEGVYVMPQPGDGFYFMPTELKPVTPPYHGPAEQQALINDTPGLTLQRAIDTSRAVTLGLGILLVGAVVKRAPASSVITGAGIDQTRIIGGGAVLGKGAFVVLNDAAFSKMSLQDVKVSDDNGAGIRHEAGHLSVTDMKFLRCQDG